MQSEILAKVIRGETIESVHRGHLLIIDGEGNEIVNIGDAETVAFIRSSAKPLQVLPFLLSGGDKTFGFAESDLRCGAHLPFNEQRAEEMIRAGEKPTQLHNNCSGKHAAMLAFGKHTGADLKT